MKKTFIFIILFSCLILLYTGCSKPESGEPIKPLNDIPINLTKRIEFSNLTITSSEKELGRSKMVTDTQDMQNIAKYLKTISCIESNQKEKEKEADFSISLIDNTEFAKSYIYQIGVSKKQIFIFKYKENETTKFIYKYTDTKVIEELRKLYNNMNYKEEFLMKK
ncbi:hypothetical protein LGK97_17005 [Clostridium sp. CS001]|uniref:hypothetical protein n=1 Tax=Clostridium sp. CS001 TaxID=2880648 RepID=UPI001CF32A9B|nr:hypothetical protein [Clostridium sp. CS001]MCB2291427.1 hypothetical protein [Clostridium sp. CS001]